MRESEAQQAQQARLLEALAKYGRNLHSFMVLEPGLSVWSKDDAMIAYADRGGYWVAVGGPLCAVEDTLVVASAFRDHAAQLRIWNTKATGQRTLYDSLGKPLEYKTLTPEQVVFAILRWSALPGASRHHWGTDIDVYDHSRLPEGTNIELRPQEAAPGGHQEPFAKWLAANVSEYYFIRPYERDLGGVSPEWWHLSYLPVAGTYFEAYTFEIFEKTISEADLALKEIVLEHLDPIYRRYVTNINL